MRRPVLLLALLFLTGCAGTNAGMQMMLSHGELRVERTPGPGYDLTVVVRNVVEPGYDPDRQEDRERVARQVIAGQCPAAVFTKQEFMRLGANERSGEWYMRTRCQAV